MDDVEAAISAARDAGKEWAQRPAVQRATYLTQFASLVRENADELARLLVMEQSKTQALASVEVSFTADYLDYMAGWARRLEGEILPSDRAGEHIFVMRKPLGVVAGILPWNFPFFLLARKMAPALVTGNTCVIKPSSQTPLNALAMARLIGQTDLPAGVFNLLSGRSDVGAALSAHPSVDMISFTRFDRDRCRDHEGRLAEHHQAQPGARRQGARDRSGRRGHRPGRHGDTRLPGHQHGPGVQLRRARLRPARRS